MSTRCGGDGGTEVSEPELYVLRLPELACRAGMGNVAIHRRNLDGTFPHPPRRDPQSIGRQRNGVLKWRGSVPLVGAGANGGTKLDREDGDVCQGRVGGVVGNRSERPLSRAARCYAWRLKWRTSALLDRPPPLVVRIGTASRNGYGRCRSPPTRPRGFIRGSYDPYLTHEGQSG